MNKELYSKFCPSTYINRDLYRKTCDIKDLRLCWAYVNRNQWECKSRKDWNISYDQFLAMCSESCPICEESLDYGLGRNNRNKKPENTPSLDHKIPVSKGGNNEINNLWIICNRCNTLKRDADKSDVYRLTRIAECLKLIES